MHIKKDDKGDRLSSLLLDCVLDVHGDVTNNAVQALCF